MANVVDVLDVIVSAGIDKFDPLVVCRPIRFFYQDHSFESPLPAVDLSDYQVLSNASMRQMNCHNMARTHGFR
jgi:hypothetical protein